MNKKTTRCFAALLAASMLPLPHAPVFAREEAAEPFSETQNSRYEIYPVPHTAVYPDTPQEFTVSNDVNVVYESCIDEDTKNYLQEVLDQYSLTISASEEKVEGKTNILLGIDGSNEAADAWFTADKAVSDDLFAKNDAYAVDVDADGNTQVIAILGKDETAAFYGVTTLDMMLSSFEGNRLIEASIEDYSSKELRGFIEGFYGGFSYEARESQIRFLRKVKGNMYVFASKTDPYHGGNNWAQTYPKEELDKIAHLVSVAKENKVRYAWSFHAGKSGFLNNVSSDPSSSTYAQYQERLNKLYAKFDQLYEVGVRDFHILNDDYNSGSYADIARFLNDVNAWLKAKGDCGPLVFCPINYNITWGNTAAEMAVYKTALDKDILLYWTGEKVNCPVIQSDVDWIYDRTGNEIVNWLNYPCSEHDKAGMYLGSIDYYFHDADNLQHTKGLMSNPVNYPEANKVAYFQLMSWLWNNDNYSAVADEVWRNSFKYIEPEVADSYEVIARHVSNCPDSGRYPGGFPESEDLKADLESLRESILANTASLDDADYTSVKAEFEAIIAAVADMKANCTSPELLSDLTPWLNSLDAVAKAGSYALDCYKALEEQDAENAWINLSRATAELAKWDDNSPREYPEKTAKAGSKRLYPFVNRVLSHLSNQVLPVIDPAYDGYTPVVYTNYPENGNTAKMIDGDESTYASWNQVQVAGDYYGVDLGRVVDLHDVEIIQGETDTHHDRFHESTLEYSVDGTNWTAIEENINASRITKTGLDVKARYVRLRVTGFTDPNQPNKKDYWLRVREFAVNKTDRKANEAIYTSLADAKGAAVTASDTVITLGAPASLSLEKDDYIGIKLTRPVFAKSITAANLPDGAVIEYSLDGAAWSSSAIDGRETVRFARIRNTKDTAIALPANLSLVLTKSAGAEPKITTDLPLKEGNWATLFDGNKKTYAWTSINQAAGQVIHMDLGRELPFNALSIYMAENRPRLYHGTVSVSKNGTDWTPVLTVDASNDQTTTDGALRYQRTEGDGSLIRYIKLDITDSAKEEPLEHSAYLKLHEIELNDAPLPADAPSLFVGGEQNMDAAADLDLTTFFEPAADHGSLEYIVPENNERNCLTIVQGTEDFSHAKVEVLLDENGEWTELGSLDQSLNRLRLPEGSVVRRVRISWSADQPKPKIYEIMMTDIEGEQSADKTLLSIVVRYADSLRTELFKLTDAEKEAWAKDKADAHDILENSKKQSEVDDKAKSLNRKLLEMRLLPDESLLSKGE